MTSLFQPGQGIQHRQPQSGKELPFALDQAGHIQLLGRMGVAADEGFDRVFRRDLPKKVGGVAQRAIAPVLAGETGQIVF